MESNSNIINIPNKEYIFRYFEKNLINHHYYSILISNETNNIIFEIKGKEIQFFYGEGRRKLNTYNDELDSTKEIELENEVEG